jgi:hypothetical protein
MIGTGKEGIVFGPFSRNDLIDMKIIKDEDISFPSTSAYIIKILKKMDNSILISNLDFPRGSVIIPMKIMKWRGKGIRRFISWSDLKDTDIYYMEIQQYGGKDFFDFLFKFQNILSFQDFTNLWKSIIFIIEDLYPYMKKGRIFMDIKMKNMVWNGKRLRLIDLHFDDPRHPDIFTPSILNMPIQFLNDYWNRGKKPIDNIFKQSSSKYFRKNHIFFKLLHRLHHNPGSIDQAIEEFKNKPVRTAHTIQRIKYFFVIYPLFLVILIIMELQRVSTKTAEQQRLINDVTQFCFETIYNRGMHILPFKSFVSRCKAFLLHLEINLETDKNISSNNFILSRSR